MKQFLKTLLKPVSTLLHFARGLVRLIAQKGFDWALRNKRFSLLRLFIFFGADVSLQNNNFMRAMRDAPSNGEIALRAAASNGCTGAVNALIDAGVDVNEKSINVNGSALFRAASNGYTDIVKTLIDKGADIYARSIFSQVTPLEIFIQKGWKNIIILALTKQDSLETYRDTSSKYGKELLIQKVLKEIDGMIDRMDKKSPFGRGEIGEDAAFHVNSFLTFTDRVALAQVSKHTTYSYK